MWGDGRRALGRRVGDGQPGDGKREVGRRRARSHGGELEEGALGVVPAGLVLLVVVDHGHVGGADGEDQEQGEESSRPARIAGAGPARPWDVSATYLHE